MQTVLGYLCPSEAESLTLCCSGLAAPVHHFGDMHEILACLCLNSSGIRFGTGQLRHGITEA